MYKISKTIRSLVLWAVVAALFIGAYLFFFSYFDKKNESVASLLGLIEQSVQSDQRSRDLHSFAEKISEKSAEIETFFLKERNVIEFLETVEGLGSVAGANVEVKSIKNVEDMESDSLSHLELNVIAEGSWRSVYHFFILLQNMPYSIDMKQVKLELTGGDEDESDTWSGIFNFTIIHSND